MVVQAQVGRFNNTSQYHSGSPILRLLNRHRQQRPWSKFANANSIAVRWGACTLLFLDSMDDSPARVHVLCTQSHLLRAWLFHINTYVFFFQPALAEPPCLTHRQKLQNSVTTAVSKTLAHSSQPYSNVRQDGEESITIRFSRSHC